MEPKIGVIMGSKSDWETMKHACDILDELAVPYEKKVVSAHRTPDFMFEYAEQAQERGIRSDYCRCRWSSPSSRDGCCENIIACHWRSSSIKSIEWDGFLACPLFRCRVVCQLRQFRLEKQVPRMRVYLLLNF